MSRGYPESASPSCGEMKADCLAVKQIKLTIIYRWHVIYRLLYLLLKYLLKNRMRRIGFAQPVLRFGEGLKSTSIVKFCYNRLLRVAIILSYIIVSQPAFTFVNIFGSFLNRIHKFMVLSLFCGTMFAC